MDGESSSADKPISEYSNHGDYSPCNSLPPLKRHSSRFQNKTIDRISNLSDSTLLHILSFLPTKDAVRTGTLSKRWQFLWTSVPNLHFDYPKFYSPETDRFITFVDQTLVLHNAPKINKFRLDLKTESFSASHVNLWIRSAVKKEVEELGLHFVGLGGVIESYSRPYKLPMHLCTNSSITKLTLRACRFVSHNRVIRWNSLKNLSLTYTHLNDDLIKDIISGSPLLEVLELSGCNGIKRLDITSTSVKRLAIYGRGDFSHLDSDLVISAPTLHSLGIFGSFHRRCCLMNLSSLVDATLNFNLLIGCGDTDNFYKRCRNYLKELLESLHDVKDLSIGTWCIRVLSIREVIGMFSPWSKRKCLILDTCFNKWDLPGITSLLRSSPILEKLVVNMNSSSTGITSLLRSSPILEKRVVNMNSSSTSQLCFDVKFIDLFNFDEENYWTSRKHVFTPLLAHLKTVKIAGFTAERHEIELVQVMLKNAVVLEKMVICTLEHVKLVKHFYPKELLEVARKMLSFPRASPNAVIIFL